MKNAQKSSKSFGLNKFRVCVCDFIESIKMSLVQNSSSEESYSFENIIEALLESVSIYWLHFDEFAQKAVSKLEHRKERT